MTPLNSCLVVLLLLCSPYATASESEPDWVRETDKADWQARDSQGEVVFRDALWILGGWFDSFSPPPRDVWSSVDGRNWKLVTRQAPWRHSDLPMTLVFKDRMWLLGGWADGRLPTHSASNEVWSSPDGAQWQQAAPHAAWSPRLAAGAVVFKDRMWILGGTENYYFGDLSSLRNDVWSSPDGVNWKQEVEHAPWPPRAYHQAVVFGDRIYLLGGGNYVPEYQAQHDVWSSTDGVHWQQETPQAAWHARLWFSAAVYRDHLWVLGGWSNNPAKNWGDVWYSADGKSWRELTTKTRWKERHEHSAFVWRDKLWIAGGHAQPLSGEVWSLEVSPEWLKNHTP